jgi:hypothetical protein
LALESAVGTINLGVRRTGEKKRGEVKIEKYKLKLSFIQLKTLRKSKNWKCELNESNPITELLEKSRLILRVKATYEKRIVSLSSIRALNAQLYHEN